MDILKNQTLEMNNVLSYRAKMNQNEINTAMQNISKIIKENDVQKDGSVTTATFSIENIDGEQKMDLEILVPLNKEISLSSEYTFKKHFKILNAVKIRHTGNPSALQKSVDEINRYIIENKLTPITVGYNVTVNEPKTPLEIDEMVIDIYVGISSNIL